MKKHLSDNTIAAWLLRGGLVAVFLYAGVSSLQHPLEWVGFLPHFLIAHAPAATLIRVFAIYELALTLWLATGRYLRYSALLCTLTLVGIVITNPSQLITTFRDVGLACMALALVFLEK
jgi:uncharacterized membrane protein YphA (DoxX/SURF4 family)